MRRIALLAVGLLVAVACGSNESPTVSSPPSAVPQATTSGSASFTGSTVAFTLTQHDFSFTPSVIAASKGASATITLRNDGTVLHNLTITILHIDQDVQPGRSAVVKISSLGSVSPLGFYCKYHRSSGMIGVFNLK
jgi:plastocyanin